MSMAWMQSTGCKSLAVRSTQAKFLSHPLTLICKVLTSTISRCRLQAAPNTEAAVETSGICKCARRSCSPCWHDMLARCSVPVTGLIVRTADSVDSHKRCYPNVVLQIVVWVLVTIVQTLPLWHHLKFFQLEGKTSCCVSALYTVSGQYARMTMHWHVQAMAETSSGSLLRQQQEVPSGRLRSTGQVC